MGLAVMGQQVPFVGHLTPQPLPMILGFSGFSTLLTNFNSELMLILTRWMPTQVIQRPMWMHYLMSSMIALNIWIDLQFSITSWLCSQGGSHSTLLSPSIFYFSLFLNWLYFVMKSIWLSLFLHFSSGLDVLFFFSLSFVFINFFLFMDINIALSFYLIHKFIVLFCYSLSFFQ